MRMKGAYFPVYTSSSIKQNIPSYNIMLRAGMVRQHVKGLYSWLPFGTLILRKVENVIRSTLNSYGMHECIMPCIQSADLWHKTGRYDVYGKETFRLTDRHNKELLLAPTAEDIITELCKNDIKTYKQLPVKLYQIHWKFRDEIRPKNGMMRSREFCMKDGYSIDINYDDMITSYQTVCKAYYEIFNVKLGLQTILNQAENGPIGGSLSHEISVQSEYGENLLEVDKKYTMLKSKQLLSFDEWYKLYAKDIDKDVDNNSKTDVHQDGKEDINSAVNKFAQASYSQIKSTEIGHIFAFEKKYTQALNFQVTQSDNNLTYPYMTSFGIGVTRVVQILVEKFSKDNQLLLPDIVNPFKIGLIDRNLDNDNGEKIFKLICDDITADILFDNTDSGVKDKINHHKLLGVKYTILLSKDKQYFDVVDHRENKIDRDIAIGNIKIYLSNKNC
ncbi:MAG: aminoacyl--tRNA ligase-related protein [Pseudomonadota bacterium]